jgi:hypothetical protein
MTYCRPIGSRNGPRYRKINRKAQCRDVAFFCLLCVRIWQRTKSTHRQFSSSFLSTKESTCYESYQTNISNKTTSNSYLDWNKHCNVENRYHVKPPSRFSAIEPPFVSETLEIGKMRMSYFAFAQNPAPTNWFRKAINRAGHAAIWLHATEAMLCIHFNKWRSCTSRHFRGHLYLRRQNKAYCDFMVARVGALV